ncbi:MAG: lipoyl(octanoyl) transferase LipB [Bacteroidetes bacterium]|jgi:lipoyl(octanoyl) transferase|nr:lipoyl(octanoyl) transferase LipB [Bacteroidota bacterium]
MNKKLIFKQLGVVDYAQAFEIQTNFFNDILAIKSSNLKENSRAITPNYLLFVEHPHVYTLGKSGDINNLLLSKEQLEKRGISFHQSNRGGDITYHGPGQLVGYPILDLTNFTSDIHEYMRILEEVIIATIAEYGLKGARSEGETGVWLDVGTPFARKICALGVKTSRWVTMHGFALNINTDLGYFDHIIPCGIRGKAVTSLASELGKHIDNYEVEIKVKKHFEHLFGAELVD